MAEMLISGLELTLGMVAARALLGRKVSRSRWAGVAIVAVGVMIVERANRGRHVRTDEDADGGAGDTSGKDRNDGGTRWPWGGSHASDAAIGVALIVLQSTLLVLQDVGEEILLQSVDFPPTEMLRMEGAYGSVISFVAVIVGRGGGDQLRSIEDIGSTLMTLQENANARRWVACLPLLFLITGIFNIKATEATLAVGHDQERVEESEDRDGLGHITLHILPRVRHRLRGGMAHTRTGLHPIRVHSHE